MKRWHAFLFGVLLGSAGMYGWMTRVTSAYREQIARADSALAQREADSALIMALRAELDNSQWVADSTAADAAAARARGSAIAGRGIRPAGATTGDSLRFWHDSATKATAAYAQADAAAGLYQAAYDTTRGALLVAREMIDTLQADKNALLDQVDELSGTLKRTRGCEVWCPGLVAGLGYSLNGTPSVFVGVGVRVDPVHLVQKAFGL